MGLFYDSNIQTNRVRYHVVVKESLYLVQISVNWFILILKLPKYYSYIIEKFIQSVRFCRSL